MWTRLSKFFKTTRWKKEWQDELTRTLQVAQSGLSVNMVVIIASESDVYSEILFLLSFMGLSIASFLAYFFRSFFTHMEDILIVPLAGFALGPSLFYLFRKFLVAKWAPRAVRERVAQKAKAQFFDHAQHLRGRLALVYFSELEREALFLASPEILEEIPAPDIQKILSKLVREYKSRDPLHTLGPCLMNLGDILRQHLKSTGSTVTNPPQPVFIRASDRPAQRLQVPILKGTKDIN